MPLVPSGEIPLGRCSLVLTFGDDGFGVIKPARANGEHTPVLPETDRTGRDSPIGLRRRSQLARNEPSRFWRLDRLVARAQSEPARAVVGEWRESGNGERQVRPRCCHRYRSPDGSRLYIQRCSHDIGNHSVFRRIAPISSQGKCLMHVGENTPTPAPPARLPLMGRTAAAADATTPAARNR